MQHLFMMRQFFILEVTEGILKKCVRATISILEDHSQPKSSKVRKNVSKRKKVPRSTYRETTIQYRTGRSRKFFVELGPFKPESIATFYGKVMPTNFHEGFFSTQRAMDSGRKYPRDLVILCDTLEKQQKWGLSTRN